MKARLSALMDGELEAHEIPPVLDALSRDESLRKDWCDYQLIRDAVRRENHLQVDLTGGVMAALQNEPTVLAPAGAAKAVAERQVGGWMALAATLAGVGVVAWMALSSGQMDPSRAPAVAAGGVPGDAAAVRSVAAVDAPSVRMQEFLVAHQTYAASGQMQSGTRYIRTVAAGR